MASRSGTLDPGPHAVRDEASALGVDLDEAAVSGLEQWLSELVVWNRTHDLTAARSGDELADLMLADALMLSRVMPRDAAVVDVGSGAGAPGLPLALVRPDLRVTLVEPLQKRVAFLRLVLAKLGRLDVVLEPTRGESLPAGAFDVAVSRATLPPPEWVALGARLVRSGGEVFALLAQDAAPEAPAGFRRENPVEYRWPRTGVNRTFVRYVAPNR